MVINRLAVVWVAALAAASPAQVWEKLITPGLVYRAEVDSTIPRMIHALRWTPSAVVVKAVPELAGGTVYEDNESKGREKISDMARRTGALAAINADFFPFTGDPLGFMVRNRELLSLPYPSRSTFGWGPATSGIGSVNCQLSYTVDGSGPTPLNSLNEESGQNSLTLNTERAGIARVKAGLTNVHAVVKIIEGGWQVGGKAVGEVQYLLTDSSSVPIAPGNCLLSATGTMMPILAGLRPGQRITFDLKVSGYDWTKVENVVAAGPNLVRNGSIAVDAEVQGFDSAFSAKRHPRSAMGRTQNGDIWFVAIDGRQKLSDGATLEELAKVMQRLGCTEAINLDGGGSTTLSLLGMVVNRPSEGKEREVANGIVFLGAMPNREEAVLSIKVPDQTVAGTTAYLRVVDEKGNPISNAEVVWSATGSGWIDQGGFLRLVGEGTVFVSAFVHGQSLASGVPVLPVPPPKEKKVGGKIKT